MRISDWSSDVCSSDLRLAEPPNAGSGPDLGLSRFLLFRVQHPAAAVRRQAGTPRAQFGRRAGGDHRQAADRKSGVLGKSGSVRVDLGGARIIKKKKSNNTLHIIHGSTTNSVRK